MPDKEMKIVQDHMSDVLNGSSCPSKEHGRSGYLRLSEEIEDSRAEATQRGMDDGTRDNAEADES